MIESAVCGLMRREPFAVIDEQFLAALVVLAHRIIELGAVVAIELTVLRVLITVSLLFPILAPELIEGEIELLVVFGSSRWM